MKIVVAYTTLSLDGEQWGYFSRDGMIGHL